MSRRSSRKSSRWSPPRTKTEDGQKGTSEPQGPEPADPGDGADDRARPGPVVVDAGGPVRAQVAVPAERLQRGRGGTASHVVDVNVGTSAASPPVGLHDGDPWVYRDRWAGDERDPAALVEDREFRAQNVYAVAAHTLALFEQHLGRPIPWHRASRSSTWFPRPGWRRTRSTPASTTPSSSAGCPRLGGRPALYTALSYDVIAHEVSHAILDGLRPRFTEPGLPDQLAFHEALADLVAMLSVFDLDGVAEHLLDPDGHGRVPFAGDAAAPAIADPDEQRAALLAGRAAELKTLAAGPAGGAARRPPAAVAERRPPPAATPRCAGRWTCPPTTRGRPTRSSPSPTAAPRCWSRRSCRRWSTMWAGRLEPLRDRPRRPRRGRVAEEGVKSARHLLAMLLRALDYLPPVDLEFADVIDAVLTADQRLAPDDDHDYRDGAGAVVRSIRHHGRRRTGSSTRTASPHRPGAPRRRSPPLAAYPARPGRDARLRPAVRAPEPASPCAPRREEVYQFIWNNAAALRDRRAAGHPGRARAEQHPGGPGRAGRQRDPRRLHPDPRTTADALPPGIAAPAGMRRTTRRRAVGRRGAGLRPVRPIPAPPAPADPRHRPADPPAAATCSTTDLRGRDGSWAPRTAWATKRRFALLHQDAEDDAVTARPSASGSAPTGWGSATACC